MRKTIYRANETNRAIYLEKDRVVRKEDNDVVVLETGEVGVPFRYEDLNEQRTEEMQQIMRGFEVKTGSMAITTSSQLNFKVKAKVIIGGVTKTITQVNDIPSSNIWGGLRGQVPRDKVLILT